MRAVVGAALLALCLTACQTPGPTAEQAARFKEASAEALQARNEGRITWKEWALRANAAFVAYLGPQPLDMQAFLDKRVYWGSEVDAKRLTPEAAQALMSDALANTQRQREMMNIQERAASSAEGAAFPRPVVCNRAFRTVICN